MGNATAGKTGRERKFDPYTAQQVKATAALARRNVEILMERIGFPATMTREKAVSVLIASDEMLALAEKLLDAWAQAHSVVNEHKRGGVRSEPEHVPDAVVLGYWTAHNRDHAPTFPDMSDRQRAVVRNIEKQLRLREMADADKDMKTRQRIARARRLSLGRDLGVELDVVA